MTRTTELPKGERHLFQKLWMDRKGKGRNNWSFAKTQPKWLCFEELCFQFIFNLATFLTSSSISGWSMSVWQEAETDFFLPCLCFFQLAKNWLCCPCKHGKIQSRSFKGTSDDTRGLFAGNFRPLSPLKFLFPPSDIILLVHSDLLWVEYRWKRTVFYLCYPIQGLHDVFWCRNAENIYV